MRYTEYDRMFVDEKKPQNEYSDLFGAAEKVGKHIKDKLMKREEISNGRTS